MNWNEYFTYDAAAGNLIWKARPREHFKSDRLQEAWNTRYAGTVAGCKHAHGDGAFTIKVRVGGVPKKAHRIIWEMHYGSIPEGFVPDHIDTNSTNNRLANLRLATNAQNQWNSNRPRNNTTGLKGVACWRGKYRATIAKNKKQKHLGVFNTPEEAYIAYCQAAVERSKDFHRFQ